MAPRPRCWCLPAPQQTGASRQQRILDREGIVVEGRMGLKPHPAVSIERDSRIATLRCLRENRGDVDRQ